MRWECVNYDRRYSHNLIPYCIRKCFDRIFHSLMYVTLQETILLMVVIWWKKKKKVQSSTAHLMILLIFFFCLLHMHPDFQLCEGVQRYLSLSLEEMKVHYVKKIVFRRQTKREIVFSPADINNRALIKATIILILHQHSCVPVFPAHSQASNKRSARQLINYTDNFLLL